MSDTIASAVTLVGALRGSGGWWGSVPPDELLGLFTDTDDTYYRAHFAYASRGDAVVKYTRARPAYVLGHLAGLDPDYTGCSWAEIEPQLRQMWAAASDSPWVEAAPYVAAAFERASSAKTYGWRARPIRAAEPGSRGSATG
jgi:hypothetical protein